MSYIADSNILLRIIRYNHPMHAEALRAVAAMQVYGISHILTFNKDDFKRFPSITVVTPAEITA
jgi:predicted nucleic acid-binding protein